MLLTISGYVDVDRYAEMTDVISSTSLTANKCYVPKGGSIMREHCITNQCTKDHRTMIQNVTPNCFVLRHFFYFLADLDIFSYLILKMVIIDTVPCRFSAKKSIILQRVTDIHVHRKFKKNSCQRLVQW